MKKKVRKEEKRKAPQLRLVDVVRRGLFEVIYDAGRQALEELLEEERARLCGSTAYERSSERGCYRAGSSPSQLVLGGRKVSVRRPRVRDEDGEVSLPAWQDMASEDPLTERIREQLMVGVSTRNYARSLETLPEDASSRSTSKSAVSRRFVSMTTMQLEAWMKRSLSELDLTIVFIDGIHIEDHVVLVALGVDTRGYKHVLGLWEGSTENAVVAKSLCEDLVERGLRPDRQMLFVLDGGKGLRRAVSDVFGKQTRVQRCQVHKLRNVLGHLPKELHAAVRERMRAAYKHGVSAATAKRILTQLAHSLEEEHPSAARSLFEGLEETLTVKNLKLSKALERTCRSTNLIENLNGRIRELTRRVKRWRGGRMVLRWTVAALEEAAKGFRRVRGYQDLPRLVESLKPESESTCGR